MSTTTYGVRPPRGTGKTGALAALCNKMVALAAVITLAMGIMAPRPTWAQAAAAPVPPKGAVCLTLVDDSGSAPTGVAVVKIDGVVTTATTPPTGTTCTGLFFGDLVVGDKKITVTLDGYTPVELTVTVVAAPAPPRAETVALQRTALWLAEEAAGEKFDGMVAILKGKIYFLGVAILQQNRHNGTAAQATVTLDGSEAVDAAAEMTHPLSDDDQLLLAGLLDNARLSATSGLPELLAEIQKMFPAVTDLSQLEAARAAFQAELNLLVPHLPARAAPAVAWTPAEELAEARAAAIEADSAVKAAEEAEIQRDTEKDRADLAEIQRDAAQRDLDRRTSERNAERAARYEAEVLVSAFSAERIYAAPASPESLIGRLVLHVSPDSVRTNGTIVDADDVGITIMTDDGRKAYVHFDTLAKPAPYTHVLFVGPQAPTSHWGEWFARAHGGAGLSGGVSYLGIVEAGKFYRLNDQIALYLSGGAAVLASRAEEATTHEKNGMGTVAAGVRFQTESGGAFVDLAVRGFAGTSFGGGAELCPGLKIGSFEFRACLEAAQFSGGAGQNFGRDLSGNTSHIGVGIDVGYKWEF